MRCEAPFEPLLLNEGNGAAENRGVVPGQVNALSTLHTDERRSLRDAQQRLILLRAARCTAHWQFEDRGGYDHKKFYCSSAPSNSSICRTLSPMTDAVAKRPQRRLVEEPRPRAQAISRAHQCPIQLVWISSRIPSAHPIFKLWALLGVGAAVNALPGLRRSRR